MKKTSISSLLEKKQIKAEDIAEKALQNPNLIQELVDGISSSSPRIRFGSAKILRIISEKNPQMLYSKMDFFINLLDSDNTILKWNAMDIIANLATVDANKKFDSLLFKKYCSFLREGNLITAAHVVENLAKIAKAKPQFQEEITEKLLEVEEISLPTEECRNILIGKTINAFNDYYHKIRDKEKVILFTRRHLKNSRNATRTKAARFLRKLEKTGKIS
jgi:hypothetical protein